MQDRKQLAWRHRCTIKERSERAEVTFGRKTLKMERLVTTNGD